MLTTIIVLILLLQVAARSIAEYYFNRYVWATQPKRGRGEESVAANKARKKASVIFDSAAIAIPAILLTGFNWMALIGLGFILWALRTFGVNVCADLGLKRELFHAFDENSTAWTDRMIYKASRLVRMEVKKFLYLLYALTMGIGIILLTIGKNRTMKTELGRELCDKLSQVGIEYKVMSNGTVSVDMSSIDEENQDDFDEILQNFLSQVDIKGNFENEQSS